MPYVQVMEDASTTLTVTAKGQVTLRSSLLDHLGARPGDRLVFELLPGNRVMIRAKSTHKLQDCAGMFVPYGGPPVSLENMEATIEDGWSGKLADNG